MKYFVQGTWSSDGSEAELFVDAPSNHAARAAAKSRGITVKHAYQMNGDWSLATAIAAENRTELALWKLSTATLGLVLIAIVVTSYMHRSRPASPISISPMSAEETPKFRSLNSDAKSEPLRPIPRQVPPTDEPEYTVAIASLSGFSVSGTPPSNFARAAMTQIQPHIDELIGGNPSGNKYTWPTWDQVRVVMHEDGDALRSATIAFSFSVYHPPKHRTNRYLVTFRCTENVATGNWESAMIGLPEKQ